MFETFCENNRTYIVRKGKMESVTPVHDVGIDEGNQDERICQRIARFFLQLLCIMNGNQQEGEDETALVCNRTENRTSRTKNSRIVNNGQPIYNRDIRRGENKLPSSGIEGSRKSPVVWNIPETEKRSESKRTQPQIARNTGSAKEEDRRSHKHQARGSSRTEFSVHRNASEYEGRSYSKKTHRHEVKVGRRPAEDAETNRYETRPSRRKRHTDEEYYEKRENQSDDDEADPLLERLEQVHQGIIRANEERRRNFQQSVRNRIEEKYNEGSVRMAEYLLQRQVVEKGLCVIWTHDNTDDAVRDDLRKSYSKYCFEIREPRFRQEVSTTVKRKDYKEFDFVAWHFAFELSDAKEDKFLRWLSDHQTESKLIPEMVFIQKRQGFADSSVEYDLPNTLIIRTDVPDYCNAYARALLLHRSSMDILTILKIATNETLKEGLTVDVKGSIPGKIFFAEK